MGGAEYLVPEDRLKRRRGKRPRITEKREIKADLLQKSLNLETQDLDSRMTAWSGT